MLIGVEPAFGSAGNRPTLGQVPFHADPLLLPDFIPYRQLDGKLLAGRIFRLVKGEHRVVDDAARTDGKRLRSQEEALVGVVKKI